MDSRPRQIVGIALVVVAVIAAVVVQRAWSPIIPDGAGSTLVARTTLTGDNGPDGSQDGVPSPIGQQCLDTIERTAGPLSLCWEAYRELNDGDPVKDYYHLRVYGSYGGDVNSTATVA